MTDGGYVMAVMGLLIVPLVIVTAFAVDMGAWYAQGVKMQRVADASALAGVVWAGESTTWESVATEVAARNGFTDGENGTSVGVVRLSESQIKVTVARDGKQYFSKVVLPGLRLTRQAAAEYVVPVPMGSPENALGNDPARGFSPNFWLNTGGIGANKANGDRFTSGACDNKNVFGCDPDLTPSNTEYRPDGYFFKVSVKNPDGRPLNIQVYDPAFVYQGDTCDSNKPSSDELDRLRRQYPNEPADRFKGGNSSRFCTGDQNLYAANISTTYIVREPDNSPLDDTNNPALCAITFDPYNSNVFGLLDTREPANLVKRGTENAVFSDHFHKYFTICNIPASRIVAGDYIIQVRTNADLTNAPPATTTAVFPKLDIGTLQNADLSLKGGYNRYAIRAGLGTPPTTTNPSSWSSGVSVFANGRLPIYVNTGTNTSTTEFYLARITPNYAAKTLQLNFWDIGDITGSADFTIIPPADATHTPTACQFTLDNKTMPITTNGCTVTGMTSGNFNGKLTQANMALPANYTCTESAVDGCWFKIRLTINGAPTDTTTWSANVLGDPVHLIE